MLCWEPALFLTVALLPRLTLTSCPLQARRVLCEQSGAPHLYPLLLLQCWPSPASQPGSVVLASALPKPASAESSSQLIQLQLPCFHGPIHSSPATKTTLVGPPSRCPLADLAWLLTTLAEALLEEMLVDEEGRHGAGVFGDVIRVKSRRSSL